MINIVIVSHSKRLAQGVVELASQMIHPERCQIAIAAGVDDKEHPVGTDAVAIMNAIESFSAAQYIVVMMDLGSAILSTETALELLEPDISAKVRLCSAPLVEGTLAAVVAASSGASIETVLKEANQALLPKKSQLGEPIDTVQNSAKMPKRMQGKEAHWLVRNPHGLHVRPASALVEVLSAFQADYQLIKGDRRINPLSLNQLSLIQIRQGDEITLIASGKQEDDAITAFLALAENGFGEKLPNESTLESGLKGILVPATTLEAPAFIWHEIELSALASDPKLIDIDAQITQFHQAIKLTFNDLKQYAKQANSEFGEQIADIFKGHIMMLDDDDLINSVIHRIKQHQGNIQQCWVAEMQDRIAQYWELSDPYLRARELDLRDIRNQVLYHLQHKALPTDEPNQPSILIAKEIFPSTLIRLKHHLWQAIALASGDYRSHSAIIATEMHLPMLVNVGDKLLNIHHGQMLKLDFKKSELKVNTVAKKPPSSSH